MGRLTIDQGARMAPTLQPQSGETSMPKKDVPYLRARAAAGGCTRYSWEPNPELARAGWPTVPLGMDNPEEARELATRINALVAEWRTGKITSVPPVILDLKRVSAHPSTRERLARPPAVPGTVNWLVTKYLKSPEFAELKPRTRRSYEQNLEEIRKWCGDLPSGSINAKPIKTFYQALRQATPTKANAVIVMGRTLWKWGLSEDLCTRNPWLDVEVRGVRRNLPWLPSPEHVVAFVRWADRLGYHGIGDAVLLNEWLGQREGDVISWDWGMYRDGRLRFFQHKTGAYAVLPVRSVRKLVDRLEVARERQQRARVAARTIVVDPAGCPYNEDRFRDHFAIVRAAAAGAGEAAGADLWPDLAQLQFMRLRHTAVTRMAEAGVTIPMIASISRHSLATVHNILERYCVLTEQMAHDALSMRLAAEGGQDDG